MKAEERAKMLVRLIQGRQESWDWHADNIASAIRSAENEALERAARAVEEAVDEEWGWAGVEAIRALKHQEP